MRKQEREARYKRIKEVLKKDPDLTLPQIRDRFHISYRKAMDLRKEILKSPSAKGTVGVSELCTGWTCPLCDEDNISDMNVVGKSRECLICQEVINIT